MVFKLFVCLSILFVVVTEIQCQSGSGIASWYGAEAHGHLTASGEPFNMWDMTAAHKELAFGTRVRVTNTRNGRTVDVRINDRGPFTPGRVIDLSRAAFAVVENIDTGVFPCTYQII